MTAARTLALVAAALALAACGKSKEEKAYDDLGRQCNALAASGATLDQAELVFRYRDVFTGMQCGLPLTSTGAGDLCGAASDTNVLCIMDWSYYPNDSNICGPTGCWLGCEVRVRQADFQTSGTAAVICAARWFDQNPTYQSF
ncbi:conserved hypothetical protein [Anaeromyxobacter dehalogenans 2CP-1]|uniref:Lipoprotein n=1 Tax=Anaeromyxobacter dehalogenans (strain ATCC BAA-258 / DSM 21875 / 2CP-1) TaxID=455488 RepID=B8JFI6_ANAD2|nr:hypothetical protein [Anaeromyxobacter dehalogenans]ACL66363.1 conserved hypothetical protein [Anaeromyxobacter dehalogenans 2CP-1]